VRLSIPAWLDLCRAPRGDPWRIVRLTVTLRSRDPRVQIDFFVNFVLGRKWFFVVSTRR